MGLDEWEDRCVEREKEMLGEKVTRDNWVSNYQKPVLKTIIPSRGEVEKFSSMYIENSKWVPCGTPKDENVFISQGREITERARGHCHLTCQTLTANFRGYFFHY